MRSDEGQRGGPSPMSTKRTCSALDRRSSPAGQRRSRTETVASSPGACGPRTALGSHGRFGVLALALLALALLSAPAAASDAAEGSLFLPELADGYPEQGTHDTGFFVFSPEGTLVRSPSGPQGQWRAGELVNVPAGTWFVSISDEPRTERLTHLVVEAGRVTIIPSASVVIFTLPEEEQPAGGCARWRAEISAWAQDGEGRRVTLANNRASRPSERGMLRVPIGEQQLEFQRLPFAMTLEEGALAEVPLGFQAAPSGEAPTISAAGPDVEGVVRVPLCTQGGMLQVPAGEFWVSSRVTSDENPRGTREWNQVTVEPSLSPRVEEVAYQALPGRTLPSARRQARPATEEEAAGVAAGWQDTPMPLLPRR